MGRTREKVPAIAKEFEGHISGSNSNLRAFIGIGFPDRDVRIFRSVGGWLFDRRRQRFRRNTHSTFIVHGGLER